MTKRSIKIQAVVQFGNGDDATYSVCSLSLPKHIKNIKGSDKKDQELDEYATLYLAEWIKTAIRKQERDDEQSGITDSW